MIRRPPRSKRTDTLFPDTTLFRSPLGAAHRSSENHIFHAPAAHGFGRAFAHDPANRFQQVGLATAVGADNSCQARFDAEFGGVNKAFEPGKFEALYLHGRASDIPPPFRQRSEERRVGTGWVGTGKT